MADEIKKRQTTRVILVHFSGDPGVTFSQLRKESMRLGAGEVGHHFIPTSGFDTPWLVTAFK
ncbi:hypothetical protein MNBD_NITROSPINAE05-1457 [hydrothermal vent metagenome]|uniref:Uncharacterized protein n=1 Tax=hydrothermal vent metagenome TaxID=652676 RepID=A0A3B1D9S9_9ZZZZ